MNTMVKKVSYSVVIFAVEKDGGTHKQQTFYDSYYSASNYMDEKYRNLRESNDYRYYEMGIYKHTEFVCEPTMIRTDIEYLTQYCNGELFKVVSSNKVLEFDLD